MVQGEDYKGPKVKNRRELFQFRPLERSYKARPARSDVCTSTFPMFDLMLTKRYIHLHQIMQKAQYLCTMKSEVYALCGFQKTF